MTDLKENYNAFTFNARGTKITTNIHTIKNCSIIVNNISAYLPGCDSSKFAKIIEKSPLSIAEHKINSLPGEYFLDRNPDDVNRFLDYLTESINQYNQLKKDPNYVDIAVDKICTELGISYRQHIGKY